MEHLLPFIWICIIVVEISLYILLDGANLGIGILSLVQQREEDRSVFLHTLGPTWNANETWLLVASGTLFGAFPTVFSVSLNALYIPGVVLLVGIILRAVSFEFYDYAEHKMIWSKAFGIGSLLTAIGQGLVIGGVLNGINMVDDYFAGTAFDWVTPFTFLFTLGVGASYIVLGDAYLIRKTGHEFAQARFGRVLLLIGVASIAFIAAAIELPTDIYNLFIARWFVWPTNLMLLTVTLVTAGAVTLLVMETYRHRHQYLYPLTLLVFACGLFGVLTGIFPYIMPPAVPYWQVASADSTLVFMLWGIGPILPIVFLYNWYLNFVFRRQPKDTEETDVGFTY